MLDFIGKFKYFKYIIIIMTDTKTPSDIFKIEKDKEKEQFIISHTYTDIFNNIPIQNSFENVNNIFSQSNKER